jgi:hypothetical protein
MRCPRHTLTIAALLSLSTACGEDPVGPESPPTFRVEVSGEDFLVRVVDPDQVSALETRLANGSDGVISGALVSGDGGFNAPWSWHLDPGTVEVPDFAVEVCDGRPSMVEGDLSYWLDTVGRFCPWGATVVERLS